MTRPTMSDDVKVAIITAVGSVLAALAVTLFERAFSRRDDERGARDDATT